MICCMCDGRALQPHEGWRGNPEMNSSKNLVVERWWGRCHPGGQGPGPCGRGWNPGRTNTHERMEWFSLKHRERQRNTMAPPFHHPPSNELLLCPHAWTKPVANWQGSPRNSAPGLSSRSSGNRSQGKLAKDLQGGCMPDLCSTLHETVSLLKHVNLSERGLLWGRYEWEGREYMTEELSAMPRWSSQFKCLLCHFLVVWHWTHKWLSVSAIPFKQWVKKSVWQRGVMRSWM